MYTGGDRVSATTTMTVRLPVRTKERLEELARSTDRSKAYIASRAIEEYLDAQEWQVRAIAEAVQEANSAEAVFLEHEAVRRRFKSAAVAGKRKSAG